MSAPDGSRVGWHDLVTGGRHLDVAELQVGFEQCIAGELASETSRSAEVALQTSTRTPRGRTSPGARPARSFERKQSRSDSRRRSGFCWDGVFESTTTRRVFRVGAEGEERVGARLDRLAKKDPRWLVVHAVPVGEKGSDIDHVVVGPAGVFTLNTKAHPGQRIRVGVDTIMGRRAPPAGRSQQPIRGAQGGIDPDCGLGFPVSVTGVIVLAAAEALDVKAPLDDVVVKRHRALAKWLRSRPEVLDDGMEGCDP